MQSVDQGLFVLGDDAALVFKDEMMATDDDLFAVDAAGDSVGHHICNVTVHLVMRDALLLGCFYHCVCHGVGVVFLQTGGNAKHLHGITTTKRHNLGHGWRGSGYRFCQRRWYLLSPWPQGIFRL